MYSLACISYYGHPATYCLNAAPIEVMDIEAGEEIEMITELPGTTDVIANSLYIIKVCLLNGAFYRLFQ
jgi:hypothetical protein